MYERELAQGRSSARRYQPDAPGCHEISFGVFTVRLVPGGRRDCLGDAGQLVSARDVCLIEILVSGRRRFSAELSDEGVHFYRYLPTAQERASGCDLRQDMAVVMAAIKSWRVPSVGAG
jgi:hypothetical protein